RFLTWFWTTFTRPWFWSTTSGRLWASATFLTHTLLGGEGVVTWTRCSTAGTRSWRGCVLFGLERIIARTGRSWFRARLWTWLRCWLRSCWFWFFSSRLFGWLWTRLWTRLCGRFWCFCCRFCWVGRSFRAGFRRCRLSLFSGRFSLCCFRLGCFWFGWLFLSRGLFSLRFCGWFGFLRRGRTCEFSTQTFHHWRFDC